MGNFHPLEVVGRGNLLWWYVKDLFIRREIIILTRDQPNCHRSHSHFFQNYALYCARHQKGKFTLLLYTYLALVVSDNKIVTFIITVKCI